MFLFYIQVLMVFRDEFQKIFSYEANYYKNTINMTDRITPYLFF